MMKVCQLACHTGIEGIEGLQSSKRKIAIDAKNILRILYTTKILPIKCK